MNILIIEDDTFKLERILGCLKTLRDPVKIRVATSVHGGIKLVSENEYNFILLDMALPSHDLRKGGASPTSMLSGGIEIIMELSALDRPDRIIVITQYPEVEVEGELIEIASARSSLRSHFGERIVQVIHYTNDSTQWEALLVKSMEI